MTGQLNGIYAAYMSGTDGQGFGMFVFLNGILSGADPMGVRFDGKYEEAPDGSAIGTVMVSVPPNATVIQGVTTGSSGMTYEVPLALAAGFADASYFCLETPLGSVNIRLDKLRGI